MQANAKLQPGGMVSTKKSNRGGDATGLHSIEFETARAASRHGFLTVSRPRAVTAVAVKSGRSVHFFWRGSGHAII
jgi:hypothetical protein